GNGNFTLTTPANQVQFLNRLHTGVIDDLDNDGDNDLAYVEFDTRLMLFFNDGSGNVTNIPSLIFRNPDNFAYILGAEDFNGDGYFDFRIYSNPAPSAIMSTGTLDAFGRPNYNVRRDANMLRGNRKHGTVHVRDIDNDGDPDYILTSTLRNFGADRPSFEGMRTELVEDAGVFSGAFVTTVYPEWANDESYDVKIMDINSDGNMDVFVIFQNRYGVFINDAPPLSVEITGVDHSPSQRGEATTFTLQGSGLNFNTSFDWDFGDGQSATTNQPSVSHTYATPDRFDISVTVTGPLDSDTFSFSQPVHGTLQTGRATSSMSIVYETVTNGADRIWHVNPDNDSVTAFNAQTGTKLAEIAVGSEPRSLALDTPGVLCVVNKVDSTVTRISTNNQTVMGSLDLPYGAAPHGIVFAPDKSYAYIAFEAKGQVAKINFSQGSVEAIANVGPSPRHLSISADGETLYVSRFITGFQPFEHTASVGTTGQAEVIKVDTASMDVVATIALPYHDDEDTELSARGIPNYLTAPSIDPTGNFAALGFKVDNIFRGTLRDGNFREPDQMVRGKLGYLTLSNDSEQTDNRIDFDDNSQPTALAFGPTGVIVFTVHEGSRDFNAINFWTDQVLFRAEAGTGPQGIAIAPDGSRAYIHNYTARSVSVFNTAALVNGDSNNAEFVGEWDSVEFDVFNSQELKGVQFFHDTRDFRLTQQKYISCAACHSEGGHDGRTWDFTDAGEGLRNTIDLRGRAGDGHGRVHWTANFDEIHDFENDIRHAFGGTGLMDDADFQDTEDTLGDPKSGRSGDLDALAAYFETFDAFGQSPHRTQNGDLTADGLLGRGVFIEQNCAACHSGATFTDSPLHVFHDIGTLDAATGQRLGEQLFGLDTPTLRGLWGGAPYLHDGSAPTVADAIEAHDFVDLSSGDLALLEAYVLQIDDSEPGISPAALGIASQSSTLFDAPANQAMDGNLDTITHTNQDHDAWWEVDLGSIHDLGGITLWNRTNCCQERLRDFDVLVSDTPFVSGINSEVRDQAGVSTYHTPGEAGERITIALDRLGRYIRVQLRDKEILSLAEVRLEKTALLDSDADGEPDIRDAFPNDPNETADSDGDGVGDNADELPFDASDSIDTDGDGIGNSTDNDDDGDGTSDANDAFPLDASESKDTDGDGIGNNADTDDDGDGSLDANDPAPLNPDIDENTDLTDTDGDGSINVVDDDDDNDGVNDSDDAFPLNSNESMDTDNDGIGNNEDLDDDNDNVSDALDAFPLDPTEWADSDGDGIGDNADPEDNSGSSGSDSSSGGGGGGSSGTSWLGLLTLGLFGLWRRRLYS
ncbi:MAG: discoidin domain-containing protein, partial [Pseudomonadota bacterium]